MEILKQNRWFPHPVLSIVLTLMWLLLNNTVAFGHILLGIFLGFVIPQFTKSFWPDKVKIRAPKTLLKFVFMVLYDIFVANISVAKLILGPNKNLKPTFFEVPLDSSNPLTISVLASAISLTPGTVSSDLSDDGSFLLVHGLHVEDINEEIDMIKRRYEKPLIEVFG